MYKPPNRFVNRVLCERVKPAKATPLKAPKAVRGTRKAAKINITETTIAPSSKALNIALISLKSS
ncbi:hypothetical protein ACC46_01055 [Francisella tularensis subsp. holarctica]|nr:hypothetical protein ACC94_03955 [Francisella tularensis subsp. holarctica]ORU08673.1 hypothetical protein ACB98_06270 [Francisella tularensis subsp. holarctica]ORU13432.1 hypothetical protein ACC91_08180 [Francisella tularensis subsp. holarctica]ORU70036.1 hypothetical protein ACC54_08465 [Francisella tularensis subsp. holarctica]ORU82677.1 hypothetical protein ACC46_01055 [Francisella tularensis subsp. holarctica]